MPAMVAQFLGSDGKALTIHRTYLNGTGKADIKSPKKLMPGIAPLVGGAIRLFPPVDKTIGVAEGIETAIAATQVFSTPCWAVVSSTLMRGFVPPDGVKRVIVFGDSDQNFVGQEAAYRLAKRLFSLDLVVDVQFPETGKDFNDFLLQNRYNYNR
jgi:putative DNA primase/helicase